MMQKFFTFLLASALVAEAQYMVSRVYKKMVDNDCAEEDAANSKIIWDKNQETMGGGHNNAGCEPYKISGASGEVRDAYMMRTGDSCKTLRTKYYAVDDDKCEGETIQSPDMFDGDDEGDKDKGWPSVTYATVSGEEMAICSKKSSNEMKDFPGMTFTVVADGEEFYIRETCETKDPLKSGGGSSAASTLAPFPAVAMAMALLLGVAA